MSTKLELFSNEMPLNAEELHELENLLNKKHSLFLEERKFTIDLDRDGPVVGITITLKNGDDSYFYPVESRIDCEDQEIDPKAAALFLIDYTDLYFEEYLSEGEDSFIPIDWTPYSYDATDFQMRGQILNKKLERMADEWLANHQTQ